MSVTQQSRSDLAAADAEARRRELDPASSGPVAQTGGKRPSLPPRWFIRLFWLGHRTVFRLTRGRIGLWRATDERWGTLRLHTVGRKSGRERIAILGYHEDGRNIVTMAMNGFMEGDPAWWLNLQANPDTTIELKGRTMRVHARAAEGEELTRLWKLFPDSEGFVPHRKTPTAIVVLEPLAQSS